MLTLEIFSVKTDERHSVEGEEQKTERWLDVEIRILEDGQVIDERRLAYPTETSKEDLQESLRQFLETYKSDRVIAGESAKVEEENKNAQDLNSELSGIQIS